MSDKTKYCKVTISDTFCIYKDLAAALCSIEYDIQSFMDEFDQSEVDVKFETVEMTEEEFNALPDFNGFG